MHEGQSTTILLSNARKDGDAAVNELITKIRPWVKRQAEILIGRGGGLRIDASDAAQEVCLRATLEFSDFKGQEVGQFLKWLSRILQNYLIDARRFDNRQQRRVDREVSLGGHAEMVAGDALSPSDQAVRYESSLALVALLERLPQHQQDVIRYRFFEQRSFADIAAIVGKSEKNCGIICLRALKKLRQELDNQ